MDSDWLGVLMMGTSVAVVLLDAAPGIDRVVAAVVKEVAAASEVAGSVATIVDEEDIAIGVETMRSAGTEGIFVWLRNRAKFCRLEFRQWKTSSTAMA